jgi:hypothetical protein
MGTALELSSLTNVDNLVTKQGAAFISRMLDRGVVPARYLGINAWRSAAYPDLLSEFWANKRYWDLVGARYMLTAARDPNASPAAAAVPASERMTSRYRDRSGVWLWENPAAHDRAFLAPEAVTVADPDTSMTRLAAALDPARTAFIEDGTCAGNPAFPEGRAPGQLSSLVLTPNTVDIRYRADSAGVLVLTDAHARGWKVTLDDRDAPLLRVDGAFRGVCISQPGDHHVTFIYRPPHWSLALACSGFGLLGLFVLTGVRSKSHAKNLHM